MPDLTLPLLALVVVLGGGLLFVAVRRPPADAGLAASIAALQSELRAETARHAGDIAQRHQALAMEQTRALGELLERTREMVGTRFGDQERAHLTWCNEQREFGAKTQAVLLEALKAETQAMQMLLGTSRDEMVRNFTAHEAARLAWAGEQAQVALAGRTALLETMTRETQGLHALLERQAKATRDEVDRRLTEMRKANDERLAEIQRSVNEQLASAVQKQMDESFNRVIDQFTAVQQMMGNVQAVASQVGDLKRLFGNVKTRGGWGEAQVKALLDDILPPGSYETNVKVRDDSLDAVEFAVLMPMAGEGRVLLPVDAKFPTEDYERLLAAWDAGDASAEAAARRGLEGRVRAEAMKIAAKYINPPRTVEFAVMYLATEGLYAEVARIPGLIDEIGRAHRIMVLGPSLLPAMLRTIQLGHVTLALSRNAEGVRDLLAATKAEMVKMDGVLDRLGKQVGTVSNTIGNARTRTRAISRKLRGLEAMPGEAAEVLLELPAVIAAADEED